MVIASIRRVLDRGTDGNTSRFKRVPPGFRSLTGQALPGGQVTPQFVQRLKSYIAES